MTDRPGAPEPPARLPSPLPVPAALAAAVAAVGLALSQEGSVVTLLLVAAFLSRFLSSHRLPDTGWITWTVRLGLFPAVSWALLAVDRGSPGTLSPETLVGQLSLAEIAVQGWRFRPSGGSRGEAVTLLSGLVFLASCNTRNHALPGLAAPVYFAVTVLALRRMRDRGADTAAGSSRVAWVWVAAALALGTVLSETAWAHRLAIHNWVAGIDRWLTSGAPAVGFAGAPQLASGPGWTSSLARVFRIEGPLPSPYLRGLSFDAYVAGAWRPMLDERQFADADSSMLRPDAAGARCRFTRLTRLRLVFAPLESAGIDLRGELLRREIDIGKALGAAAPAPWTYEVVVPSRMARGSAPLADAPDGTARERYLAVPPEIDPRVRELAGTVTRAAADPRSRIEALAAHLRSAHGYSLHTEPGAGDPLSAFLLERKSAHCEYFASAVVILARCVGVPARYISGYFVHEAAGPDAYMVRQQDAHAWAETWIDGEGWRTVEATPADGMPFATAAEVPAFQRMQEAVTDFLGALRSWMREKGWKVLLAAGALGLIVWGASRVVWPRARGRRPASAGADYACPDRTFADLTARFDRLLRREGIPCPTECPWTEHLERSEPRLRGPASARCGAFRDFARAYATARFGRPPGSEALAGLAARLAALEGGTPREP